MKIRFLTKTVCLIIATFTSTLLSSGQLKEGMLKGKVISVHDGDTFTLFTSDSVKIKVRLQGVDCPELQQDYGDLARQFTDSLIFGNDVVVERITQDRYRRTVGIVHLSDGRVLNEELIKAGLAWHYLKYDKSPKLDSLQSVAKVKGCGLWHTTVPVSPWSYRHPNR